MSNNKVVDNGPDRVLIKWVKKANMWCTTKFEKGKQTQVWTAEKPNGG